MGSDLSRAHDDETSSTDSNSSNVQIEFDVEEDDDQIKLYSERRMTKYPFSDALAYKSVKVCWENVHIGSAIVVLQLPNHARVVNDRGVIGELSRWHKDGFVNGSKYACDVAQTIGFYFMGTKHQVVTMLAKLKADPKNVKLVSWHDGVTEWKINCFTRISDSNQSLTLCKTGLHFFPNMDGAKKYSNIKSPYTSKYFGEKMYTTWSEMEC